MHVLIVGAGIGGLTLALELADAGISCRLYEAVSELREVGVGLSMQTHATKELARLGVEEDLSRRAITTKEMVFFNRFGQLIHREPAGLHGGNAYRQYQVHRGDLQAVLINAVRQRLGEDIIALGHRCVSVNENNGRPTVRFLIQDTGAEKGEQADVIVGCDGIHSAVRRHFYPNESPPVYSGINLWRGVSVWPPFLTGASVVRAGWIDPGKMVIYPIRDNVDGEGNQLINWAAEVSTPEYLHDERDWNQPGRIEDFIGVYQDWSFDWLDAPAMIHAAEMVLEYPMVDRDPLNRWTFGRVTLLGDAAHPMLPRGGNGAAQAILDAHCLRRSLETESRPEDALKAYERERLPLTNAVVRANRLVPPDVLIQEVRNRTNDQPFDRIENVITESEIAEISERYRRIATGADPSLRG